MYNRDKWDKNKMIKYSGKFHDANSKPKHERPKSLSRQQGKASENNQADLREEIKKLNFSDTESPIKFALRSFKNVAKESSGSKSLERVDEEKSRPNFVKNTKDARINKRNGNSKLSWDSSGNEGMASFFKPLFNTEPKREDVNYKCSYSSGSSSLSEGIQESEIKRKLKSKAAFKNSINTRVIVSRLFKVRCGKPKEACIQSYGSHKYANNQSSKILC
eukprot:TRINITY_DN14308_c0_g1_i2.p1 TRINITY_DN14308_c0_g1~~TRINITY_DN14308_c0_g1_i2.p1  ORF type:complete len:219 (-),score=15.84 TRINITY_DN14308_c0_g1_i2:216-872(-)